MRAGLRIGKYVLDERIAVGGMAEVWAARAEGPQGFVKSVALKFLLESFAGDPELERLFVNEARIAAQLQHANLVTVFDFDKVGSGVSDDPSVGGRYYIAMERVEGHDLRRIGESAKRAGYVFPVGLALYLGGEVCKALRYVHERRERGRALGLVHRDVSPHNVLVGYGGEVKLSDFGIAKTRAHTARGTKTGTVRGKLAYASPEQLNGEQVDHRTDQFALGVTLWELLAGRRLFDGQDELETIGQVVRCAIPPLAETAAGRAVPAAVEGVLRRMLSPRRADRFPSTADALSALLALPSYSPDGAALGDLVRTLFLPSALDLPPTLPIQAAPAAAARLAETRTMNEPARWTPPDAARSQATTRPQRPVVRGSQRTTVPVGRGSRWSRLALAAGTVAVAALAAVAIARRLAERDDRPVAAARAVDPQAAAPPAPAPQAPLPPPIERAHRAALAEAPAAEPRPPAPPPASPAPESKLLARAQPASPPPPPAPPSTPPTSTPIAPPPLPAQAATPPAAPSTPGKNPNASANGAAIIE